jgi:hypothetical protein
MRRSDDCATCCDRENESLVGGSGVIDLDERRRNRAERTL